METLIRVNGVKYGVKPIDDGKHQMLFEIHDSISIKMCTHIWQKTFLGVVQF